MKNKQLKRWETAQEAEKEWWQSWKSLRSEQKNQQIKEYWQMYIDFISKHVPFEPDWKVVDIGCGPDGIINQISTGQRYGLDPLMDYYASKFDLPSGINWKQGTMEEIPYEDCFFNVAITTNTLDHTLTPENGLKEIRRVLDKDGFVVVIVHCFAPLRRSIRVIKEKVGMPDKPHPHCLSDKKVKEIIADANLSLVTSYRGIGTWGMHYLKDQEDGGHSFLNKLADMLFWFEEKVFGYSCIDYVFIAQKD